MTGRKTRVMHDGRMTDAVESTIVSSKEDWNEFTLDDGTVVRAKVSLLSAARIVGKWDEKGNPVYSLQLSPAIGLGSVPAELMAPDTEE